MWKDPDGNTIEGQYVAADGTIYPANFPREEIPGLTEHPDPVVVPTPVDPRVAVLSQIDVLESSITDRMWREDAISSTAVMDFGPDDHRTGKTATQYIAFVDEAVAVLRASL